MVGMFPFRPPNYATVLILFLVVRNTLVYAQESPREQPETDRVVHWSFQPLSRDVPGEESHPIDALIARRLTAVGLDRSAPADAVDLIRRMYLDLHGLPATPSQVAHWSQRLELASTRARSIGDSSVAVNRNGVVRTLVDELLSSPRYGERWAQHWLDVIRYADTHGFEVNTPRPNAWPYRDYVIRAFNDDKPYDRFVFEQLAGDTNGEDAATGFMVAAAALLPGQIGKDEESKRLARQDELDEIIVGTTATFLGLTVGCARCHDHKFDPIPQRDYYAMQAFFAGVAYGDREIRDTSFAQRIIQADGLESEITDLKKRLNEFQPIAFTGRTIVIDDEDLEHVTLLETKNGHGTNPDGRSRGYRDDVGDSHRFGNLSQSRYTWWNNESGKDVFSWNPATEGRFRLWISWGVHGSGVHTRDARYVLDSDGDLSTRNDQTEIAQADQYYFVGVSEGETEKKPMWSGLLDVGLHNFTKSTRLILRGGKTNTGITADVIVLQEPDSSDEGQVGNQLAHLRSPVSALHNVERFDPVSAKFVRFTSLATIDDDKHEPCIDELEVYSEGGSPKNVALAEHGTKVTSSGNYATSGKHQLKHINDGKYGNSLSWISNQSGKGWAQLEFVKPETISRIEWARDREGKFNDRLAIDYQIETSLDGKLWSVVARSDDRLRMGTPHNDVNALLRQGLAAAPVDIPGLASKLTELKEQEARLRAPKMVFAGTFRVPALTRLLDRGNPERPLEEVAPHVLTSIGSLTLPKESSDQDRRTALANWLGSAQNPLTARVMVNRIWQYHFGVGLVETSSDFGLNGTKPSHPQLLDWLASEFIDNGWSVKHIHRLIMSSLTYQQSSRAKPTGAVDPMIVDATNRLLWRFPSRRLEAEAIRDCLLHVSGQLNLTMGGPGFDFFKTRGGLSGFPAVEQFTSNEFRRMIYAHKIRMERVPVFGAFDCPDAGLPTPRRSQSTTAIQALNLFNSRFIIEQADVFARRIQAISDEGTEAEVNLAFQLSLARNPTTLERTAAIEVANQNGLSTVCRALFNCSEFLFIP